MEEKKSMILTGLFTKTTQYGDTIFVGGRLREEDFQRIREFAEKHDGMAGIELVVEPNKTPKDSKSPGHYIVVKKKFVPQKRDLF